MALHPLKISEIVALVGHFLPLWTLVLRSYQGDHIPHNHFQPATFHTCFLVSKLWYRILLPILWREYFYSGMVDVPPHVIEQQSVHFRRFISYGGVDSTFNCTSLKTLTLIYDNDWMAPNMSPQAQKQLVRMNPGLESLEWDGSPLAPKRPRARLDTEDFRMLGNLRHLQLDRWDGSQGLLVKVLQAVARNLEEIDIQEVVDFMESDLTTALQTPGDGDGEQVSRISAGEQETGLEMPRVRTLRVCCYPKNNEMIFLAGSCPNLQQIDLDISAPQFEATRLASTLRDRCTQLHTLKITDSFYGKDSRQDLLFGHLIRDCSFSGLTMIEVSVMRHQNNDRNLLSSILRHAATLEHLVVDYYTKKLIAFDVEEVLRLLVQCRRLKVVCLNGSTGIATLETLAMLKCEAWGCTALERLDLHFGFRVPGKRTQIRSDHALADISSTKDFMGWYCHAQKSYRLDGYAEQMPKAWLFKLFKLVEGLERLQVLTWCDVVYTRSPDPRATTALNPLREYH
ncbi:MAG: hypothetical protein J3R72DRAFT_449585 [Linnemannia gamsii]|nr:MAG: hypothetical protein J3R72DRAFT_449585 [Linnemannia gamsii]